jgi:hypothetical protein
MAENRRHDRELIDDEVAVIALTWEDQERLRRRILGRLRALARRFSWVEPPAVQQDKRIEHARSREP